MASTIITSYSKKIEQEKKIVKSYVLDSFALIAYFEDNSGANKVEEILILAKNNKAELFLSLINLGEIYYIIQRERGNEAAERIIFVIDELPIEVTGIERGITIEAAKIKATNSISYADSFAAALALQKKATIITGDPELHKIESAISILWI
ncbi:MAG: type II toxin-antitoxin system VapC family toxin [Actinobacteria bacterium]|nr:type II toxin-antitoxin system VapC family toxin [Actinomycetota bacterium]